MIPDVIVEIGFTGPTSGAAFLLDDPTRGRLNTGTLAAGALFVDVTAYVQRFNTRRGASRADGPLLRYESGTATIVLRNDDRRFDPTFAAGPYAGQVEPMREVRIRGVWGGITYPLWRGFADDWRVEYDGPDSSVVILTCVDGFAILASWERGESAPVGGGEKSGARVNRILDSVQWPAAARIIAAGDATLQATTLAGSALSEVQLAADSEVGEFYIGPSGHAVFRNRKALFQEPRSLLPQAVFGDDPASAGELPYTEVGQSYDRASIYNHVTVGRVDGTPQFTEDAESRSAYLTRTYSRTDLLLESDAACLDCADYLLRLASRPELRFTDLTFRDVEDARVWPHALGREIGDRIEVCRRPPPVGSAPIVREVFVRGIEHERTASPLSWKTTFVLESATRASFLVLDNPTLGALNSNALSY